MKRKLLIPVFALICALVLTLFSACKNNDGPDTDEPDIPRTSAPETEPDTSIPDTSEPLTQTAEPAGPSTAEPETPSAEEPDDSDNPGTVPDDDGKDDSDDKDDNTKPDTDDEVDKEPENTGKYSVTFNTDKSGASYTSKTVKADVNENVVMPQTPSLSGYVFRGWYTGKNGAGTRITSKTVLTSNITAYAFWKKLNPRTIGNQIVLGCYDSFTEEQLPLVSELGLDWVFHDYDHSDVAAQTAFLDKIAENNLKAMILDQDLWDCLLSDSCTPNQVKDIMSDYVNHESFYGYWFEDEPEMDRAVKQVKNFINACPDIIVYAELVGPQGAHVHAGAGNEDKTAENYRSWLTSFVKNSNTNILCDGIYPISGSGLKTTVDPIWLIGLVTGSEVAKEYNIPHSMYICCTSNVFEQSMHVYTEKDMRFQGFSALAAGCSKINYFMINGYNYVLSGTTKTKQFDYIKEFNRDAHSISSVYEKYQWEAAVGIAADKNPEYYVECISPYISMTDEAKYVKSIITDVKSDRNLLIGAFSETKGSGNAVFFVNQDNPSAATSRTANVTFKADKAVTVTAYIDGGTGKGMSATVLKPDASGVYSLSIPVGDGIFVEFDYGD